jgi:hypothetical protein
MDDIEYQTEWVLHEELPELTSAERERIRRRMMDVIAQAVRAERDRCVEHCRQRAALRRLSQEFILRDPAERETEGSTTLSWIEQLATRSFARSLRSLAQDRLLRQPLWDRTALRTSSLPPAVAEARYRSNEAKYLADLLETVTPVAGNQESDS